MLEGTCLCGNVRWRFTGIPESATACNCTACRRYGVLWAYGYEGEGINIEGDAAAFRRGASDDALTFNFCARCGSMMFWRSLTLNAEGRRRIAVNLRMAEPERVADIPVDHFDGLDTWQDLPADGRRIKDMWF
jgi:hypothetical protein